MALAWCMSASRALRGPLSGSCRPRSPRCAAMERTALQELDSLERGQLPAPSANRRRRLPRFSLRVERESSELSLCGEREGVKKGPTGAEGAGAEQAKLVETERPMDDGLRGDPFWTVRTCKIVSLKPWIIYANIEFLIGAFKIKFLIGPAITV